VWVSTVAGVLAIAAIADRSALHFGDVSFIAIIPLGSAMGAMLGRQRRKARRRVS
jgi:hypothetical protein